MFDAARDRPQLLADIHALKNWEVRQAAINAGVDVGQMHVGSRQGLGPEQVGRQALLDQMIRMGVKPEEIPGLARPPEGWEFTRHMAIPPTRVVKKLGGSTTMVLHHELGHGIIAGGHGVEQLGIMSHQHPDIGPTAAAAASMDHAQFLDANGKWDAVKIAPHLDMLLEIGAGGVAANEVIDGIPRHQNPGRYGDIRGANALMDAAKVPVADRQAKWDAAVDRAVETLRPLADMIRDEVTRREDNLPVEWHFSKRRVDNIVERAKREALEAAGQQPLWGHGGAAAPAGGPGAPQGAGIGQGPSAPVAGAPPQPAPLKAFRAPKIIFDLMGQDASGQMQHIRMHATGTLDVERQLKRQYPHIQRAVIIGETGRKPPGPVALPYEEGESPFKDMVSEEDVEGRARREEKRALRASTIGRPQNPTVVAPRLSDGKPGYFGPLTPDQYVAKWQTQMTPQEIQQRRDWYPEVRKNFNTWFGDNIKKLGAWALSQKSASPSKGMLDVQRTQDIMQGQRRVEIEVPKQKGKGKEWRPLSGGTAEDQIRQMLEGETPSSGVAAKLHDFMDAILGRATRTWMGDRPQYGQPAPIDIHGGRGTGFVDDRLIKAVEEQYGKEAASQLTADFKASPSEAQYAHASKTYNDLAEELNRRDFMGGGWNATQVQAVDWAATGMQIGRPMELPASIFDRNTRRIAYEVNPNANSPLGKLAQWEGLTPEQGALVTHDTAEHAIKLAMKEAGGQIANKIYGPGGWMDFFSPSARLDVLASPEAAERAALVLGHLLGQEEVLIVRPRMAGGNGHVFEITEKSGTTLSEPNQVEKYWQEFRKNYPRAEGFMPTRNPDGTVGMSIAKKAGHFNAEELAQMKQAARNAAAAVDIGEVDFEESPAEVIALRNGWPNEEFMQRLKEIAKPGIVKRMREYEQAIQKTYIDSYRRAITRTREAGP